MILIVDNYDSFTYNLYQYVAELGARVEVKRNDEIDLNRIPRRYDALILSPGPGRPAEAGLTLKIVAEFSGRLPILGVCLGHQAIGEAFGGRIRRARKLMHGKTSEIHHNGEGVFHALPNPFVATRYHSLTLDPDTCPDCLTVTARTDDGTIMAIRHNQHPTVGVQFHPESILTLSGKQILSNFLEGRL